MDNVLNVSTYLLTNVEEEKKQIVCIYIYECTKFIFIIFTDRQYYSRRFVRFVSFQSIEKKQISSKWMGANYHFFPLLKVHRYTF